VDEKQQLVVVFEGKGLGGSGGDESRRLLGDGQIVPDKAHNLDKVAFPAALQETVGLQLDLDVPMVLHENEAATESSSPEKQLTAASRVSRSPVRETILPTTITSFDLFAGKWLALTRGKLGSD
jgi:hypothetical protein